MRIELLKDFPEHVDVIARWLNSEWGKPESGDDEKQLASRLRSRMSHDSLPMHLIALEGSVPVGFIALKLYEMDSHPDREHWLGSLFVPLEHRGRGIGHALIREIIHRSQSFAINRLSLQTKRLDGGLYSQHGWIGVEKFNTGSEDVLIMERFDHPNS